MIASPRRIARADYVLMPEDNRIFNLLGGELRMTPAASLRHQDVVTTLARVLSGFVLENRLGKCWVAAVDVFISDEDIVQPDVLFLESAALERATPKGLEGPPTLAVEVLSPSTRRQDEVEKRALYERFGVPEYWLIDIDRGEVRILRREAGGESFAVELVLAVSRGERLSTPLLPGFELPLSDLFA